MTHQQKETDDQERSIPVLTPPLEEKLRSTSSPVVVFSIISALVLLVVLSAIVVWLLPSKISRKSFPTHSAQQPGQQNLSPVEIQPRPHEKEAERLLGEWLKRLAIAETENVPVWGGLEYAAVLESAEKADQMFKNGAFQDAQTAYLQAIENFEVLLTAKNDTLIRTLEKGLQALQENDSKAATHAFEMVLAIDPQNKEALHGIERARTLDWVLSLYNEGLRMEKKNDLEGARKLLQEAVDGDREFIPAAKALGRVHKRVQDIHYQDAMGRALTALDRGDLAAADQAVAKVMELRPEEPAVIAAARILEEKKIGAKLIRLQQQADKLAADEKWGDVLEIYQKALKIDPEAGFAIVGQIEANERYQLDQSINGVLAKPERLQDDGPLGEARQLLARAKSFNKTGPLLQSQVSRLEKLVAAAATHIDVTLRSDNATNIEIYHVGRFNPFYEKRLALRPGKYIIVGRRPGFRDVRLTVEVKADNTMPLFVFIRCEEPL
ncbi:MAG: hypothetical protein OEM01_05535 [Desulfobulbaceae bacterium]|nr:hypothetical protein [Desulfobulbaceae bacterium]